MLRISPLLFSLGSCYKMGIAMSTAKSIGIPKDRQRSLLALAQQAAGNSYSPYSHFRVGAALLTRNGQTITGTNVENRSYGLTICAERGALCAAISQGAKDFTAIAVYSPDATYPIPPCGACRQVLTEFASSDFAVIMACPESTRVERLSDLLPFDSLQELRSSKGTALPTGKKK